VQFFNTLREIKFETHAFKSICENLYSDQKDNHRLHVTTHKKTEIKIDKILRHYMKSPPTVQHIARHETLFSDFADINVLHLANCINTVLDRFIKNINTEKQVLLYFKYILCVACVTIMAQCYNIRTNDVVPIELTLPVCSDTICPAFEDIVRNLPDGLMCHDLHLAIMLYHMVSQTIKYVDAASVITTTTIANDHVRVAERAQIVSPHDELLYIIKQAYEQIQNIAENREADMPIVNSPIIHKEYLSTKVHHPHATNKHSTSAITLPPHTYSEKRRTRKSAADYDSGDIPGESSGSDSDNLSEAPMKVDKRHNRKERDKHKEHKEHKERDKHHQIQTTTKNAATETAENTTTHAAATATTAHKPTVKNKV
jgi:hypothetical protein